MRHRAAGGLIVALALVGCGSSSNSGPVKGMTAYLRALSAGDPGSLCRDMTASASGELATQFGGSSCLQTARAMIRYVATSPGEEAAVAGTVILPTLSVPLSPAPYRRGSTTSGLRLIIADPVLGQNQAFDVTLREVQGRWMVDGGVAGMFTLLTPPDPAAPSRALSRRARS